MKRFFDSLVFAAFVTAVAVQAGWVTLPESVSQILPVTEPSPFPTDSLRVLIVSEKSAAGNARVDQITLWLQRNLGSGSWRWLDLDTDAQDLQAEDDWVRAAMQSPRQAGDWLLIGSPRGGYSGALPDLAGFETLISRWR